jgi:hypothetical protein
MKALRVVACVALIGASAESVDAQVRRLPTAAQQQQKPGLQLQPQLQPIPIQQPGNMQVQGNIVYGRQPSWMGNNTVNGQLLPPISNITPYPMPTFPQMNPLANPYANPLANPYANPLANPYANPLANPYANPLVNPYANPLSPYANPLVNPLINPYGAGSINPLLNPYQTLSPSQQLLYQQMQLNAYQQQFNPMNPLAVNTIAPVVGVGQSGFAVGR